MKIFSRNKIVNAMIVASSATAITLANLSWAAPTLSVDTSNGTMFIASDSGAHIYVRIAGPNSFYKELKGTSLAEWNPGPDAPDGAYRYDSYSSVKIPQGTMSKSDWDRAMQQNATQTHGGFTVENGLLIPSKISSSESEAQSRYESDNLLLNALSSMLDILVPMANAADVVVSSDEPVIDFTDTDFVGDDSNWEIETNTDSATFGNFEISDAIGANDFPVIAISGAEGNLESENSLVIGDAIPGDIGLADNTIYIDKSERTIGIGTITPATDMHIMGAGFVELSLQSTIQGSPRWELEADEEFIGINQDDSVPKFVVFKDAEESTLVVGSIAGPSGNVGIGTSTPAAKLDVQGDINATFSGSSTKGLQELLKMSANNTDVTKKSDAGFVMENARANFAWAFRTDETNGGFSASKQGTGARELELINTTAAAANVELRLANGGSNVNGVWLNASSRSYKKNIHELNSDDAMQALRGLKSVKYQYKRDRDNEQKLGFIAEDVPELVATKDRKTLDPMQIVAVLTKVAQEQGESLQMQDESLQALKTDVESKNLRIAKMEAKIASLILMQEKMAKTMETRFTPFAPKTIKVNQQITVLDRD